MDVLLLCQPARQAVLLDTARWRGQPAARWCVADDVPPNGSYLSSAEEPRRARIMSLVRSSVGPGRGGDVVTTMTWSPPCCRALVITVPWLLPCHGTVVATTLRSLSRHGAVMVTIPWCPPHHKTMTTSMPWPPCHMAAITTTPGHWHATGPRSPPRHNRHHVAVTAPSALTDGVERVLEFQREGSRGHVVAHRQHRHR